MKDREAFIEDKIKEFNEIVAHKKGLEIRWNEEKRKYDRARGGTGVQIVNVNPDDKSAKRSLDIRQYEVGLDLVKLPEALPITQVPVDPPPYYAPDAPYPPPNFPYPPSNPPYPPTNSPYPPSVNNDG